MHENLRQAGYKSFVSRFVHSPRRAKLSVMLVSVFLMLNAVAEEGELELDAEIWARPRSGLSVTQLPTVQQAVQRWMQNGNATIEIRFPGGESGTLWATELRDWLVALGVPGDQISTRPGSPSGDKLLLTVVEHTAREPANNSISHKSASD